MCGQVTVPAPSYYYTTESLHGAYSTGAAPTGPSPDAQYDGVIEGQDQDRGLQQKKKKKKKKKQLL